MTNNPIARNENIVVQELENEILIYDLTINKAYCLNETSGLVFQLCDGKRTVSEISDSMTQKLKTKVAEEFVWLALNQLKQENLLENSEDLPIGFGGLNRRQVIKKVGLASMITLPLISSIMAPGAAMAQSGLLANYAACATNSQCLSNNCVGSISGGMECCAAGVNPTNVYNDASFCVMDLNSCNFVAQHNCCSGSGTLGFVGCEAEPVNKFRCDCNP